MDWWGLLSFELPLFGVLLLLAAISYDLFYLLWYPYHFLAKTKTRLQVEGREPVGQLLSAALMDFPLKSFPKELQQRKIFHGLRRHLKKKIRKMPAEQIQSLQQKYLEQLPSIFFEPLTFPIAKEDLALIDYKLRNSQREMDFALGSLKERIEHNLAEDLIPFVERIIEQHEKEAEKVRRAILKDQDTLPILGMEIPLSQAAKVISQSGGVFHIEGIRPKSLSTIASKADPRYWDIFCELIVATRPDDPLGCFNQIFPEAMEKGETIPYEFLEHSLQWLKKSHPKLSASQLQPLHQRLEKLKKLRPRKRYDTTKKIEFHDDEAREMLSQLKSKHLASVQAALDYLNLSANAQYQPDKIRTSIGVKKRELNQALGFVAREKRKKLLVEIHFLSNELQKYLLEDAKRA